MLENKHLEIFKFEGLAYIKEWGFISHAFCNISEPSFEMFSPHPIRPSSFYLLGRSDSAFQTHIILTFGNVIDPNQIIEKPSL